MGFKKLFTKKDPKVKIKEKIIKLEFGNKAINLFELFSKSERSLVNQVVNDLLEEKSINGLSIGKKGWFLPQAIDKLEDIWLQLAKGSISLKDLSQMWGLNRKRTFMALENYTQILNLQPPALIRKKDKVYISSYLTQIWMDSLVTFDLDERIKLENVINHSKIKNDDREVFEEFIKNNLKEKSSDIILGIDGILRKRNELDQILIDNIPKKFDEGLKEISFSSLAEDYGVSQEEISKTLLNIVEEKEFNNVTIYPLDEVVKLRL